MPDAQNNEQKKTTIKEENSVEVEREEEDLWRYFWRL